MKIQMELLSDTIFGNGVSIPGAEDISVQCDRFGFPYYKGSTFKGVFREELERYLTWTGEKNIKEVLTNLLGEADDDDQDSKIVFSNFEISPYVKKEVMNEIGDDKEKILECFTNMRTFTSIDDSGVAKQGSLRMARCINKGLLFYGELNCKEENATLIKDVLPLIKWIGSMRNRGFGKVKVSVESEGK